MHIMAEIVDNFGRRISYLRISVTDRCNLRCVYCMPAEGLPYVDNKSVLTDDEIMHIVTLLARHGLRKVRITGGEPLVRNGVSDLIARIIGTEGIEDVGLTTNAILLPRYAEGLRTAGLRRVNISLDTLRADRFQTIARHGTLDETLAGLRAAEKAGFSPIKLNMVVMRGLNDDEVREMVRLTLSKPYEVRFLEYMPIGIVTHAQWRQRYVSNDEVLADINSEFAIKEQEQSANSTARTFKLQGAIGSFGLINPISHRFCSGCNRLRLTANGAIVPCLSDNYEYDLRTPLRAGESDEDLLGHIRTALSHKPEVSDFEGRVNRGGSLRIMAQIGG